MMPTECTITDDIYCAVANRRGVCRGLIFACPHATWSQVFLEMIQGWSGNGGQP